jgi:hypothetical protein
MKKLDSDREEYFLRLPSVGCYLRDESKIEQRPSEITGRSNFSRIKSLRSIRRVSIAESRRGSTASRADGDSQECFIPEHHCLEADFNLEMSMLDGTWQTRRVVWTKQKIAFARVNDNVMIDVIPLCEVECVQSLQHEIDPHSKSTFDKETTSTPVGGDHLLHGETNVPAISLASFNSRVSKFPLDSHSKSGRLSHLNLENLMDNSRMGASVSKKNTVSTTPSLGLRIRTVPNGFNSGRVYVLRACTEQQRAEIIADLTRLADEERKRAEARSRFKMNQASRFLL